MSKNSGGRGRGWLKLNKNAPSNPSHISNPVGSPPSLIQSVNEDNFIDAPDYMYVINTVKMLNIDDDGIKFNQKIRHLLEKWKEDCPTGDDVEKSFEIIYQACLTDDELASKLVYMISSRSFISQEVQDKNIRLLFLAQLQKNVDGSDLYKTNPVAFRNCTKMLGEFYNKGRLVNGDPFSFMAAPLVKNLQMLLENGQPEDLQLLAVQLYMNGSSIKAECPEQLTKLMNDTRIKLLSNELTDESKLWLLLCIEGVSNRFGLLSAELYKFYQDHIGESAMATIQATPSILSVQTSQNNKTLDSYQSNVNVLQVSNSADSSIDKSSQFSASDAANSSQGYTSGFVSDSSSHNSSYRDASQGSGKHGRPILGAGARLHKVKAGGDAGSARRESGGGWGGKPKGGWADGKKGSKPTKGWEHDDRFENDYS